MKKENGERRWGEKKNQQKKGKKKKKKKKEATFLLNHGLILLTPKIQGDFPNVWGPLQTHNITVQSAKVNKPKKKKKSAKVNFLQHLRKPTPLWMPAGGLALKLVQRRGGGPGKTTTLPS